MIIRAKEVSRMKAMEESSLVEHLDKLVSVASIYWVVLSP